MNKKIPLTQVDVSEKISSLIDTENGTLNRTIYSDEEIYKLEMERIFARTWNFMCHESQIPNVGDYVINYIGEDQVIVVRDKEENINVLLNTCTHRGNALCRTEQGNAKSFICSYHGWNFDLQGKVVGIPGLKDFYRDDFDKEAWGLKHAAKVDSFEGFVFANLDPEAPSLYDYLGDVGRTGLSMITAGGEVEVVPGIQKNVIDCNWKIAVDNLFDWYHVRYSHHSAFKTGFLDLDTILQPLSQMVMLGEYGHGISGPMVNDETQELLDSLTEEQKEEFKKADSPIRLRDEAAKAKLGPFGTRSFGHPNIFPNVWVSSAATQICLRLPRGPHETELWWYTFVPKDMDEENRKKTIYFATHLFGPAGLLEQDDGENWSQATRTSKGIASGAVPHNMKMSLGKDKVRIDEATGQRCIETTINEHGQRWTYNYWAAYMQANSWETLHEIRPQLPEGDV